MESSISEILEAIGCKDVEIYDSNAPIDKGIHEMGKARMWHNPKTSIVNKYNQVHIVPNIYVMDGACMTPSADQNPLLT